MDSIKIQAPATVANLSCGFDVLGVCLNEPYDEIEIIKIDKPKVQIDILDSKFSNIPNIPSQNTGGVPAALLIEDLKLNFGFNIKIKKGIPLCGGLGSSAATSVGVVYAINQLLDSKLSDIDLLKYALEGEKVSVSNPHADNIAPGLLGGMILIRDTSSLDISKVPINNFYFAIIHPDIKISTEVARNILPPSIKLDLAIQQWGNLGSLINAFHLQDLNLIKKSMQDVVIEPYRSSLIKFFDEIKKISINSGALGFGISGSGPSMFALCENENIAKEIVNNSKEIYLENNIDCDTYVSTVNNIGPKVI